MSQLSAPIETEMHLISIQEDAAEIIELLWEKAEIDGGEPCEKLKEIYSKATRIQTQLKKYRETL